MHLNTIGITLSVVLLVAFIACFYLFLSKEIAALAQKIAENKKANDEAISGVKTAVKDLGDSVAKTLAKPIAKELVPQLTSEVEKKVAAALKPRESEIASIKTQIDLLGNRADKHVVAMKNLEDLYAESAGYIEQFGQTLNTVIPKIEEPFDLRQEQNRLQQEVATAKDALENAQKEMDLLKSQLADEQKTVTQITEERDKAAAAHEQAIAAKDQEWQAKLDEQTAVHEKTVQDLNNQLTKDASAHQAEIANLKDLMAKGLLEKDEACQQKLLAKDEESKKALQDLRDSFEGFAPEEVCRVFNYQLTEAQNKSLRTLVYSYLALLGGSLRERDFATRFESFDRTLFDTLRDSPETLVTCRKQVEQHFNPILLKASGGLQITWVASGSQFDSTFWNSETDSGTTVDCCTRALIYREDPVQGRVSVTKGRVRTV